MSMLYHTPPNMLQVAEMKQSPPISLGLAETKSFTFVSHTTTSPPQCHITPGKATHRCKPFPEKPRPNDPRPTAPNRAPPSRLAPQPQGVEAAPHLEAAQQMPQVQRLRAAFRETHSAARRLLFRALGFRRKRKLGVFQSALFVGLRMVATRNRGFLVAIEPGISHVQISPLEAVVWG